MHQGHNVGEETYYFQFEPWEEEFPLVKIMLLYTWQPWQVEEEVYIKRVLPAYMGEEVGHVLER